MEPDGIPYSGLSKRPGFLPQAPHCLVLEAAEGRDLSGVGEGFLPALPDSPNHKPSLAPTCWPLPSLLSPLGGWKSTLRPPQVSVEYWPHWIQTILVLVANQVFSASASVSRVGTPMEHTQSRNSSREGSGMSEIPPWHVGDPESRESIAILPDSCNDNSCYIITRQIYLLALRGAWQTSLPSSTSKERRLSALPSLSGAPGGQNLLTRAP